MSEPTLLISVAMGVERLFFLVKQWLPYHTITMQVVLIAVVLCDSVVPMMPMPGMPPVPVPPGWPPAPPAAARPPLPAPPAATVVGGPPTPGRMLFPAAASVEVTSNAEC